jgi:glucose-1-phosphate adenylyltransferase
MPDQTLTVVLAGNSGRHLKPLVDNRAKAAIPFGGKYRIIDFTLANCLNSGLRRILVLTQHQSHSLEKHLRDGWSIFNPEISEYITAVPPQMDSGEKWNRGSASALYNINDILLRSKAKQVLMLSGDHIYRMDYAALLKFHLKKGGTVTAAYTTKEDSDAKNHASLTIGHNERLTALEMDSQKSLNNKVPNGEVFIPMGIFVVSMDLLLEYLEKDQINVHSNHDFFKDVIPVMSDHHQAFAYRFGGSEGRVSIDKYWADVATLDGYYEANMALLKYKPPIDLYQNNWPIRTYPGQHPPARTVPGTSGTEGICINSIVANGVIIAGGSAQHSILFAGAYLADEAMVQDSILFQGVYVGEGAHIKNAIVDKSVKIPEGESIGYDLSKDRKRFTVTPKGIVIIPRDYAFK